MNNFRLYMIFLLGVLLFGGFAHSATTANQLNVSFSLSTNSPTVRNLSVSNNTTIVNVVNVVIPKPNPPIGFTEYYTLNISTNNAPNVTVLYIEAKLDCGFSNIVPFELQNGAWSPINPYIVNSSLCNIDFKTPPNSTVSLMKVLESFRGPVVVTEAYGIVSEQVIPVGNALLNPKARDLMVGVILIVGVMGIAGGTYSYRKHLHKHIVRKLKQKKELHAHKHEHVHQHERKHEHVHKHEHEHKHK